MLIIDSVFQTILAFSPCEIRNRTSCSGESDNAPFASTVWSGSGDSAEHVNDDRHRSLHHDTGFNGVNGGPASDVRVDCWLGDCLCGRFGVERTRGGDARLGWHLQLPFRRVRSANARAGDGLPLYLAISVERPIGNRLRIHRFCAIREISVAGDDGRTNEMGHGGRRSVGHCAPLPANYDAGEDHGCFMGGHTVNRRARNRHRSLSFSTAIGF